MIFCHHKLNFKSHGSSAHSCTMCGLSPGTLPAERLSVRTQPTLAHMGHVLMQDCVSPKVQTPVSNFHKALLCTSREPDKNYCKKSSDNSEGYYCCSLIN